jgi:hypothetical protein
MGHQGLDSELFDKVMVRSDSLRTIGMARELKTLFHSIIHGRDSMPMIEALYNSLGEGERWRRFIELSDTFARIPVYLAEHFKSRYEATKLDGVSKIWTYKRPNYLVIEFTFPDYNFAIDIVFGPSEVDVSVTPRAGTSLDDIKAILNRQFPFPHEHINGRYRVIYGPEVFYDREKLQQKIDPIVLAFAGLGKGRKGDIP